MDSTFRSAVALLSNSDLLAHVKHLAQRERQVTAALIAHLAELDSRHLYLSEGYSSLFAYCTQVLHLSEHAAYGRIKAARLIQKLPVTLERLEDGSMNLTTLVLLAPHLTQENHQELLEMARHKSRREVEKLVAGLRPQPPVPASIRRMLSRHNAVAPISPQYYMVKFTASAETYEKLRRAQDLLRHQIPDGDPAAILDRALTALLEKLAKQKFAATNRPHASCGAGPGSRHIPAQVKRVVWLRDGGQCAFVAENGHRCTERGFLEYHHVDPFAAGGKATVENIQLRCRAHNGHDAEAYFGTANPKHVNEERGSYIVPTRFEPSSAFSASSSKVWPTKDCGLAPAARSGPGFPGEVRQVCRPTSSAKTSYKES